MYYKKFSQPIVRNRPYSVDVAVLPKEHWWERVCLLIYVGNVTFQRFLRP